MLVTCESTATRLLPPIQPAFGDHTSNLGMEPQFDPKLFYEPLFDDQKIFESIKKQSGEIIDQMNKNEFQFSVKNVKEKRLAEFVSKFKETEFFLICFQIKPDTKGKGRSAKLVVDMNVRPEYLAKIDALCIVLGDKTIHRFENHKQVTQLVDYLIMHGFEFAKEHVVGISFDAKHTYKILKCCFEFGEDNLRKITWYDPKLAHWSLDTDVKEPENLLHIADEYLDGQLEDVDTFLADANKLIQNPEGGADYSLLFRTILLYPVMVGLKALLQDRGLFESYVNIEMPALLLFGEMELTGFTIDILKLRKSKAEWQELVRKLILKLKARNGGVDLNPRSPQQVQNLLKENGLYEKYIEKYGLPEGMSIDSLKTGKEILEKVRFV